MLIYSKVYSLTFHLPYIAATVEAVKTLAARNTREQWETVFNKHYVQPVLGNLEQKVGLAMQTILSDNDQS